ncbi:conserved membrane protein [Lachnospiraceae bacterium KM106-2]|nr:conserved membrane protein [Lachnospiraceae bacterium KM106-2]
MTNKVLDSYKLKWIAIITMVIDHTGAILFNDPKYAYLRLIGRLAFPIFCFLLVEGFYHTSNVYKYLGRLAIFAFISEVPFDMMYAAFGNQVVWSHQNVFFTLLIGLSTVFWIDKIRLKYQEKQVFALIIQLLVLYIGGFLAEICCSDYGALGIFMIIVFYFNRGNLWTITILNGLLIAVLNGPASIEMYALLAIPLLAMYNGEKGKSMKYFFYAFYPVHIVILCLIKYYIVS